MIIKSGVNVNRSSRLEGVNVMIKVLWAGFAYSAAHENVVELHKIEEYKSCDVKNPVRMYTDGLNKVSLKEEGIRYFASGNPESCKKGLKLQVEVQPQEQTLWSDPIMAAGPTPSASAHASGLPFILFVWAFALLCCVSL